MALSLDTAYRSFGGEVEASSTGMSDILCKRPLRRLNCSRFLHQPDIVIDPMVANSGRAASSVKAAAAAGGGRRPAFTELADRPNSGRRIRRLIDILVIALIPENANRTEWRTGPWRQSTRRLAATSIRRS